MGSWASSRAALTSQLVARLVEIAKKLGSAHKQNPARSPSLWQTDH